MEKKRRPFTEKEDQTIILCLAKATSSNISDAMREASTLTGRSFQSCYQRYLDLGKPTPEKIKKQEKDFEDWKMVHAFFYEEGSGGIKGWVNAANFTNIFRYDWESLMELVEKIEELKFCQIDISLNWCRITYKEIVIDSRNIIKTISKKEATYQACVEFIKFYNKSKKDG